MSEKPKRPAPAIGQRIRHRDGDVATVIGPPSGGSSCWTVRRDDGTDRRWDLSLDSVWAAWFTFLGYTSGFGPTPTPGEGKGMEARPDGKPARCLKCGGDKSGFSYACGKCAGAHTEWMPLA